MMDDFEDHCWKDMVTPDILEIYGDYARGPRLDKSGKPLPPHHHLYARYRGPYSTPPAALPHAPEYGFLCQVPPNAIRGPGYTFVPGVGILGESCDLPAHARTSTATFTNGRSRVVARFCELSMIGTGRVS